MELLFLSFFTILITTFISLSFGMFLTNYFPFKNRLISSLFLSPAIGLAVFIIISIPIGYLITNKMIPFLVILCISIYLHYINIKKNTNNLRIILIIFLFMIFGSLFSVLFTVLYYGEYNPFNDTYTYIAQSQWLQNNAFINKTVSSGFYPAISQVTAYQNLGARVGPSFLMSIIQSGLNLNWSYYVYPGLLSCALGFSALASTSLISFITNIELKKLIFSALIIFIMPSGIVYGAFSGFYPMTFGLLFVIGFCSLIGISIANMHENNRLNPYLILSSSILFSAFLYSYNDYLPFLLLGAAIAFVLNGIYRKQIIIKMLIFSSFVFLFTLFFVNLEIVRIIQNLIVIFSIGSGKVEIGWPIYWNPAEFIGFMVGLKSGFIGTVHNDFLNAGYSFLILFTVFYLINNLRKNVKFSRGFAFLALPIGLIAASIFVFIKMRYFTEGLLPNEQGATFLQLKTAKYASPFFIILMFSSYFLLQKKCLFLKKKTFQIFLIYFFLCVIHNFIAMKNINGDFVHKIGNKNAFNQLIIMKEFIDSNIPKEELIYLDLPGPLHKLRQMVAYIFMDRKVYGNYSDDGYINGWIPENERNMNVNNSNYIIRHTNNNHATRDKDIIKKFGNIFLVNNNKSNVKYINTIGGYDTEYGDREYWNWTSKEITYNFVSPENNILRVNFTFHTMIEESHVIFKILIDEKTKVEKILTGRVEDFKSEKFIVDKNSNISLKFISSHNGKNFGNDPRYLNFLVKDLKFEYE